MGCESEVTSSKSDGRCTSLWSILADALAHHGERLAVVDGARRYSYRELGARVRARAAELVAAGIGAGERVAVLDLNSAEYLEAYFATALLGAVLVPLNHRLAPPELAFVVADAGARVLCAAPRFAAPAAELRARCADLTVLALEPEPRAEPLEREPARVDADTLAQLYYTSGTTGRSKGVMLTHANVGVHARAAAQELGLARDDRWGHVAPMFHLADAWAVFAITLVGGVHVMSSSFEAEGVLALIERERISVTNLIPTMLNLMVKSPRARDFDLSSMRLVLSGGAPIAPALVRTVIEVFGCLYAQTYGMTETSPYLTLGLLPAALAALPPEEQLRLRARTGRPFRAVELEVVDEAGRSVPRDDRSVGEIRVRGATVSPGYWNRPAETAAAFRGGWLYTGDLAVIDAHGFVDIVDRKKDMILSGGENVYSTEVEHALYAHAAVLEAAVFGVPDETWGEVVRAAVVLRPGATASAEELIAHCRTRIAGYKAPRAIDFRSELPKTGSGKIEKHVLRTRAREQPGA